MQICSVRIYMITFICCSFVTKTVKNGNAEFSFIENVYLRISEACRALSDPLIATKADVLELQNTVSVIQIEGDYMISYPVYKYIASVKDISVNYCLISKSINRNVVNLKAINESKIDSNDDFFVWIPINETIVKRDVNMTKWVPIDESVVRHGRNNAMNAWSPVNESLLFTENNMYKWFPLNNTLTHLIPHLQPNDYKEMHSANEFQNVLLNNSIKWYPINDSSEHIDDKKTIWHPIKSKESHMDPENRDVHWFLKEEDVKWYPVNESHVAIKRPNINVTRETKIIIHGFGASPTNDVTLQLAMAYHNQNLFNVLLFDAEVMFGKVYFKCVKNAQLIGKALADIIIYLESFGAKAADFHLIGVSLGAHAAGWAGKYYRHSEGGYLGRITGLDPAGPCFTNVPSDARLDKNDALYVDVIHSNSLVQGLFEPIGHADFFLNGGGPFQPGCMISLACCHLRAAYVYTESISRPDLFVAVKCDTWTQFKNKQCFSKTVILGHASSSDTRGVYYLRTTGQPPYGLGIDGIRPKK